MDVSEQRGDGVCWHMTLFEKHDHQTGADSVMKQDRPDPPAPRCESDTSRMGLIDFKDGGIADKQTPEDQDRPDPPAPRFESDTSRMESIDFKDGGITDEQIVMKQDRPDPPAPRCESDTSRMGLIDFKDGGITDEQTPEDQDRPDPPAPRFESDTSRMESIDFKDGGITDEQIVMKQDRPDPPAPRCESDTSRMGLIDFKDGGITDEQTPEDQDRPDPPAPRFESDTSRMESIDFKDGGITDEQIVMKQDRPDPPAPRCESDTSRMGLIDFKDGGITDEQTPEDQDRPDPPAPRCESDTSRMGLIDFKDGGIADKQIAHRKRSQIISKRSAQKHQTNLDSIFTLLEENIVSFVKSELKKFKTVLSQEYPQSSERLTEDDEVMGGEEKETSSRNAFLKITLHFLKSIKQEQLADSLQSRTAVAICQRKLKAKMKTKFQCLFEGLAKAGNPTLLNQIYTELYITPGESREVNNQHEVRQIEAASQKPAGSETTIRCVDIFKPLPGKDEPVRTLVTSGVAGIGKTVLTQRYILDWAEAKANHNVQFIFPFTFRELSLLKEKKCSLVELLHHFFIETKKAGICRFEEFQVVFILDGLDECRLHLDFRNHEILTDVTEPTSVEVLLTNLIRGNLLPSARLWITTRPAAANQIPPECIDMVTEVRGFTDPQKEEYFRKRSRDEKQANTIISHIKTSRSLHIMCHIPVFCWMTATVLEHVLKTKETGELPKTLTEMYMHFLVVQTRHWNVKYHTSGWTGPVWNTETKETILALGKLAFEQLEKGNLIFCEADLKDCGTDVKAASVYSGLLTEIFKDEQGLNQDKRFCFVHLSIQEFLAALFVFLSFIDTGVDLQKRSKVISVRPTPLQYKANFTHLFQRAVDKALQSPNGHLDLFVRFLLGLSVETNQTHLRGLLTKTGGTPQVKQTLVQYIKKKISGNPSPEKIINLLHCLNELNEHSVVEEIQQHLRSGNFFKNKLSTSQWATLAFILLSSQEDLNEFDLKKFSASEEGLLRLLPVVQASKTSLLSGCNLSSKSCEALVSVLKSKNSSLRKLDLSNNDLCDTGAMLLSAGLQSPNCRLETLSLSGCQITEKGCTFLVSALNSNPSHLRELDLSFNHLGASAVKLLSAGLADPHLKLETLRIDHCGECRLKASYLKYFCQLSLDPNTADRNLSLSDDNRQVMVVKEKQTYPDHPERFESWNQVLGSEGLTGRSYWEVRWKGGVNIGVTYRGIKRRGGARDGCFGLNDQSWSLSCSAQGYTPWHDNTPANTTTVLPSDTNRVAVYLDWPAGTVSFYCLSSTATQIHLHTFHSRFTEPLYPAFGFGQLGHCGTDSCFLGSSVSLSQMDE